MERKDIKDKDLVLLMKVRNQKLGDLLMFETILGEKVLKEIVKENKKSFRVKSKNNSILIQKDNIKNKYLFVKNLENKINVEHSIKNVRKPIKNTLNDFNGAQWKFSSKSVISKVYPLDFQHKLRSQHGGQKPPMLCADLIKIFTKKNDLVLDPYAGVGGTLLGATSSKRRAIGIEIDKKWKDIYLEVCRLDGLKKETMILGDSLKKIKEIKEEVDFILTDPPYWNMDKLQKTRRKDWNQQSKLSNFIGEDQTKEEWIEYTATVLERSAEKLKNKGYMAVFMGDIYRGKEYHLLGAELSLRVCKIENIKLKANLIWFDQSKTLHIYGYPTAFIPSLIHQNILIFRKETQ